MPMDKVIIIAIFIFLMLTGVNLFLIWQIFQNKKNKENDQSLVLLQNQIAELNRTLDKKLSEASESTRWQLTKSAEIIKEITERLTKLDETNKQVMNFADQLKHLQDILKNPKQRGVLGEYYLETVLKNVLPPGIYQMQYPFSDGTVVDAVVFVKEKIIPIDSKFSLENYNRLLQAQNKEEKEHYESAFINDLKNRIDEASKYVKPEENTMEFVFMFIPSEAVYYDLLINKVGAIKANTRDLISYAAQKKVIVVSPTTFLAFLQTVLQGLKALQIEESAKEIQKRVEDLNRHLTAFSAYMSKLGNHLNTAVGAYNTANRELGKINKDIFKITGEAGGVEIKILDNTEKD